MNAKSLIQAALLAVSTTFATGVFAVNSIQCDEMSFQFGRSLPSLEAGQKAKAERDFGDGRPDVAGTVEKLDVNQYKVNILYDFYYIDLSNGRTSVTWKRCSNKPPFNCRQERYNNCK